MRLIPKEEIMKKYLLTALLVLGCAAMVYAAPVGLTSEADLKEAELLADNNIGISASLLYDSISERSMKIDNGNLELDIYTVRLGVSVLERFNIYVDIGQATDAQFTYQLKGDTCVLDYEDDAPLYGVGVNALIYRWDNGLEIGANVNYRQSEMTLEQATVTSSGVVNTYTKSAMTKVTDGDFEEVQLAAELAYKNGPIIPYVGIKYSDVDFGSSFTVPGQVREASGTNSQEVVGGFVGITFAPELDGMESTRMALNVEGRFIDEEALSVGLSYQF